MFHFCPITGPVAGAVCSKFGPRAAAMVGGLIASIGMIVSSQSSNIIYLIISLGFFAGEIESECEKVYILRVVV